MPEVTAELPMLALIFTRKLRPMIIGSLSGWLMLAGMMARPRATSSRTNSGVIDGGIAGAEATARDAGRSSMRFRAARCAARAEFSRSAMNSISGVTMPLRA